MAGFISGSIQIVLFPDISSLDIARGIELRFRSTSTQMYSEILILERRLTGYGCHNPDGRDTLSRPDHDPNGPEPMNSIPCSACETFEYNVRLS